jgi:hypothetical protein
MVTAAARGLAGKARVLGAIAIAAALLAGGQLPARAAERSLSGVVLGADDPIFAREVGPAHPSGCVPSGTSTLPFAATGDVTGPYPGRMTISGTITVGPQADTGLGQPTWGFAAPTGTVEDVTGSFTITSGSRTITGTITGVGETLGSWIPIASCMGVDGGDHFGYENIDHATHLGVSTMVDVKATIDGATVTGRARLAHTLTCFKLLDGAGGCGYADPNRLLVFTRLPVLVQAPSATRYYGEPDPTFVPTVEGLVDGDTAGPITCTTTATASSEPGTYPVTCAGWSSTKYAIVHEPGTLTILKTPTSLAAETGHVVQYALTQEAAFAATLTTAGGAPIPGQQIAFVGDDGATRCTGSTDATGRATCAVAILSSPTLVLGRGYSARFAGDPRHAPSTASAAVELL